VAPTKNICDVLFVIFSSHENDLEDPVAECIWWRSSAGNTLTKIKIVTVHSHENFVFVMPYVFVISFS
jgi:hypothetical protein